MSSREIETEIAVKIALLEPKDIARLRGIAELASVASVKSVDGRPSVFTKVLRGRLSHFLYDVLGLKSSSDFPPGPGIMPNREPDKPAANVASASQCLLGITTSSLLAEPANMRPADLNLVKLLLGRLCELVDSVHEVRELSDFGWQSNDFNSGWHSGLGNSEYDLSLVLNALRSPEKDWLPPKDPAGSGRMPDFITYWFSLCAIVLGHLAWSNPTLGVARWVNSGMPGDGGILSGLKRLYGADVAALILNRNVPEAANMVVTSVLDRRRTGDEAYDPSQILLRSSAITEAVGSRRRWSAMSSGGSDSLHLNEHLRRLLLGPGPQPIRLAGGHDANSVPRAHLLLPDAYGWYESLHLCGDGLPDRSDGRSWRVDVTSAPLGYIGEFRKSRETGRWFAGKHSSHMLGN